MYYFTFRKYMTCFHKEFKQQFTSAKIVNKSYRMRNKTRFVDLEEKYSSLHDCCKSQVPFLYQIYLYFCTKRYKNKCFFTQQCKCNRRSWLFGMFHLQFSSISINIIVFLNNQRVYIWMPPSLSEFTPMIINTGLTHLGSEASICTIK